MRVGDEYVVRMPGPWDGPVRVAEVSPHGTSCSSPSTATSRRARSSFRAEGGDGSIQFEIESWARGGDRLSNLLYDHLRMSKEIQLHMWTSFLERVIRLSGRESRRAVVDSRRAAWSGCLCDRQRELDALRGRPLNLDLARREGVHG